MLFRSRAGEILLAPMRHALERAALSASGELPEIIEYSFGEWTETRGAIALALDHVSVDSESVALPA